MCQRYSLALPKEKLVNEWGKLSFVAPYEANYNIAPGNRSWIISNKEIDKAIPAEWGLIPHWSKYGQQNGTLFNGKVEGIASKASFRIPIRNHRCIVLADSFYVWRSSYQKGEVYRVVPRDGSMLCFAGVYDIWQKENQRKLTYSILTQPANKEISLVNKEMPVVFNKEESMKWLQSANLVECLDLLKTQRSGVMHIYKITDRIKDVNYNTIDLHSKVPEMHTLFDL